MEVEADNDQEHDAVSTITPVNLFFTVTPANVFFTLDPHRPSYYHLVITNTKDGTKVESKMSEFVETCISVSMGTVLCQMRKVSQLSKVMQLNVLNYA